ncbi:hypothetical protein JCM21900_003381 [Sporobolomyces salmonicolor]
MSGISFKITAPPRASSSSSSAAPSRPSSSASRARPSPAPRQDHDLSDSDEDADGAFGRAARRDSKRRRLADEEVVEFGREGATSKHAKPAPAGPLVIPALPNKDWRKAAEELRAGRPARGAAKKREIYLPETSGGMRMASTTTSTSGTSTPVTDGADRINAEEAVGGLDMPRKLKRGETEDAIEQVRQEVEVVEVATPPAPAQERPVETEEQRALRELLSGGEGATEQGPSVEVIYSGKDERNAPIEEADAFKRDVESRPDMASLEDYARVPVGEFGLAMLRGMGWAPGQAASRSGRGAIEAHVPSSRPALLGIGAKPMAEAMGDGGKGKDGKGAKGKGGERKSRREEMRFVPLVKQAREGGGGSGRSTPLTAAASSASSSRRVSRSPPRLAPSVASSRHASRSPPRSSSRRDRDRDRERSPRRDRDHERGGSRYDDPDRRGGSSRRDDRERETDRDRSDRRRDDRDRDRERDRDRSDRRRDERDRDDRRTRDERERSREGRR